METPKYVSLDKIPVQIPDDYTERQKMDAMDMAESSIELDLKGGNELNPDEISRPVVVAIQQKATCELIKGSPHPDDVTLGDFGDDGATKMDYAQMFCDEYENKIEDILNSDLIDEGVDRLGPYVYTTNKPR